ncbi:MAG: hypothetical protein P8J37_00325, partial [Fuerstiella sp.]|nr:hypothetical protein [Fuerstiella sp.]
MCRFPVLIFLLSYAASGSAAAETSPTKFYGAWAFVLPDGNPAWLKLGESDSQLVGSMLWSVRSARPVNSLRTENDTLTFERKISWRPFGEATVK